MSLALIASYKYPSNTIDKISPIAPELLDRLPTTPNMAYIYSVACYFGIGLVVHCTVVDTGHTSELAAVAVAGIGMLAAAAAAAGYSLAYSEDSGAAAVD